MHSTDDSVVNNGKLSDADLFLYHKAVNSSVKICFVLYNVCVWHGYIAFCVHIEFKF